MEASGAPVPGLLDALHRVAYVSEMDLDVTTLDFSLAEPDLEPLAPYDLVTLLKTVFLERARLQDYLAETYGVDKRGSPRTPGFGLEPWADVSSGLVGLTLVMLRRDTHLVLNALQELPELRDQMIGVVCSGALVPNYLSELRRIAPDEIDGWLSFLFEGVSDDLSVLGKFLLMIEGCGTRSFFLHVLDRYVAAGGDPARVGAGPRQ